VRLIRLTSKQKNSVPVHFSLGEKLGPSELLPLIKQHLGGDHDATTRLVLGNSYLAAMLVGRYLYYWPQTKRFLDDMLGEALLAIAEHVNQIDEPEEHQWLVHRLIVAIKYAIENFLNRNQAIVRASFSTNKRRSAKGEPLEYARSRPIFESDGFTTDDFEVFLVDLRDSYDTLANVDGEELIDLVLSRLDGCSEEQHQLIHWIVRTIR